MNFGKLWDIVYFGIVCDGNYIFQSLEKRLDGNDSSIEESINYYFKKNYILLTLILNYYKYNFQHLQNST